VKALGTVIGLGIYKYNLSNITVTITNLGNEQYIPYQIIIDQCHNQQAPYNRVPIIVETQYGNGSTIISAIT